MKGAFPKYIQISERVKSSLEHGTGVVALESTVITHGLPYPQNIETLHKLEHIVSKAGATPATVLLIDGVLHIGLQDQHVARLEAMFDSKTSFQKLSVRDMPMAIASRQSGGTTVSATMQAAALAGIKVFATGGIGGVHRDWQSHPDVSADLIAFSRYPVIVVSAGCKAILDIPATLEKLESLGIPLFGWQTDKFPAFYSSDSPFPITRVDNIEDFCRAFTIQNEMADSVSSTGMLVANPIPRHFEIPASEIEPVISEAIASAKSQGIVGKALTPYLLSYLAQTTKGKSVAANLHLLENNARLGAEIANYYAAHYQKVKIESTS